MPSLKGFMEKFIVTLECVCGR